MNAKRISRAAKAACIAALGSLALASCGSLPRANDPAYQRAERDASEALPFDASLFAAMAPSELPALEKEVLAAMPAKQASSMRSLLSSTRMAYLAYTPPWGAGAEGAPAWYALLSGRYSGFLVNAGLSGAKGVKRSGDWYELQGGVKLALYKDRYVLATNADMASFLERMRAPALRLERAQGGVHPIGRASRDRASGIRIVAPQAGSGLLGEMAKSFGSLPVDSLSMDVREAGGEEIVDAEFAFQSETGAKVFAPAVRAVLGASVRLLGLSGPAPELKRDGSRLRAEGLKASPRELSSLVAAMSGKAK